MNDFNEIYIAHYKAMYRVAKKMIGNIEDTRDILQDIFIDFYHKSNNGNVIRNPGSWLYKATVHKCVDALRKHKKFTMIEPYGDLKSEEETNDSRDLKESVELAMLNLKPREKVLVTLYSEGLSYREMAGLTGIRFSSIGKILSRTLKKLAKELKNQKHELY